ncbi:ribonuclease P protein component [Ramlibacter terrae]|uniref:Ribonuclease P protein component n=1 Tax=Ramlibacter terrae TaxID=2732511 RepID=A0ABX6P6I4_9BURK|nr:ribonuclease P protein component [Ramlibacter terrae]
MQRLKTKAQFEAAMAGGTVSRTAHFVLHRAAPQAPTEESPGPASPRRQALFAVHEASIGAVIPKRWAKRAVTRNGIKRQIYNVSASFEPRLPHTAHVVRLRSDFARAQFKSAWSDALKVTVRAELQQLFAQMKAPR